LAGLDYREVSVLQLDDVHGDVGLLAGSGSWCAAYHEMPARLRTMEERFSRVIVLPSSFDLRGTDVRSALEMTGAKVFARERVSFDQISDLCDAELAHDTALYFDYRPYEHRGQGVLTAYRTDREADRSDVLPPDNVDISETCDGLDEWLWTIARHELIRTDRAHVTIAAALLGKRVEYTTSNYHKVPAMVEFSLRGRNVERVERLASTHELTSAAADGERYHRRTAERAMSGRQWLARLRRTREEIESLVPPGHSFIFVDDDQWGREPVAVGRQAIPFLERDGTYFGPPADDIIAITELERARAGGASFIIFAWPSFWWLDHYVKFIDYLEHTYRWIWRNDRIVAVDLR
jgi:hypothetical protein